jgi:hypothetical protein
LLEDARTTAKKACADGKERTKGCIEANRRIDDLVGKWSAAGSTLAKAPVVAGEGDVAHVAAWLGGYVTDRQVSLYLPLLWPITMASVGAFVWGVWGDSRPTKVAPVIAPATPPPCQCLTIEPELPRWASWPCDYLDLDWRKAAADGLEVVNIGSAVRDKNRETRCLYAFLGASGHPATNATASTIPNQP